MFSFISHHFENIQNKKMKRETHRRILNQHQTCQPRPCARCRSNNTQQYTVRKGIQTDRKLKTVNWQTENRKPSRICREGREILKCQPNVRFWNRLEVEKRGNSLRMLNCIGIFACTPHRTVHFKYSAVLFIARGWGGRFPGEHAKTLRYVFYFSERKKIDYPYITYALFTTN